jgi:hypothetical protein
VPPAPTQPRPTRRAVLRRLAIGLTPPALLAAYATQVEPFWPQFHELPLHVPRLPAAFEGARIAQLTDLHVASRRSLDLCRAIVDHLNTLRPDLVVVTGDLVTHQQGHLREACELLDRLRAPTFVSFGNHDSGRTTYENRPTDVADDLQRRLQTFGRTVLRNRAVPWQQGGTTQSRLWIMGLEDLWGGRFSPAAAFAGLPPGEPVIALSHNPDTAPALDGYGAACILSGHTHGGQIRIPALGPILMNVQNRQHQKGLYYLTRARLYVSRGAGYLTQARLHCRPEVPIFTLTLG